MEIEQNAKVLSEKLELCQAEKAMLQNEFNQNETTIERYTQDVKDLQHELASMKSVIAGTFNEELQTAGSMNPNVLSESMRSSKMKKK